MNTVRNVIMSALESRGYAPRDCVEDGEIVIRCAVNVLPLTLALTDDEQFVDCGVSFDLLPEVTDERMNDIRESLREENAFFTNAEYREDEDEQLLLLYARIPAADFTADTVNSMLDTIENKDGIVASLKRMSRTKKELRTADDLAEAREILEKTITFFTARGYEANYFQEDLLQVDCNIDGGMFAITCEGTEYTLCIDSLYFLDKLLTEEEENEILEIFNQEYSPFENIYMMGDELSIQSEFPYEIFSEQFLEDVLTTLTRKDGYVAKIKEIAERRSEE